MKLLVIEDEVKLAGYLAKGLSEAGFVVDLAHDGIDGLHMAMEGHYDLLLLDGMLPGIDGLGVLAALRRTKATPVLMLTARGKIEDRETGLQAGADDYMVKPFAFSELAARIQGLLRRASSSATEPMASSLQLAYLDIDLLRRSGATTAQRSDSSTLRLGSLEVDMLRRRAVRGGGRLDLTAREFTLLTVFLARSGEVLSRTQLAEQVWDMNFDSGTNVVDVAVRRLRSKIDDPFEHPLLHTVRGMGYVLEERAEVHTP